MSSSIFLTIIPDFLLNTLGRYSYQAPLAEVLRKEKPPILDAFKQHNGNAYPLRIPGFGMDLMLQCVNPEAPEDQWLWGLDSVTVHTAASSPTDHWTHWPESFNADKATLRDAVAAFGAPLVQSPTMAMFESVGAEGQNWALHCAFDAQTMRLKTFMLARSDDWAPMPVVVASDSAASDGVANNKAKAADAPPNTSPAVPPVICGSRGRVPKTGVYEGRIPENHGMAHYFNTSKGRFTFREEGDTMISMGLSPDSEEALVTWTWLRDRTG